MKIKSKDIIIGDNFSANLDDDTLIIKFPRSLIISNAFFNGGMTYSSTLINHSLNGKKDCGGNPFEYIENILRNKSLPSETVTLMTAVLPQNFHYMSTQFSHIFLSMGLDNSSNPLDDFGFPGFGTINIIVILKNKFTSISLMDLYKSLVELKAYFMLTHSIKSSKSDLPATGTFTDVMALVSGKLDPEITYSGPATKISHDVSISLMKLMEEALDECK